MSDQHVSAYQQLLAATDAIGEVGRASSARLKHTLKHALVCMLAALDLPEGAIYLYSPQMNNLALAAAVPSGGVPLNTTRTDSASSPTRMSPLSCSVTVPATTIGRRW